jgi:hypothetical protein
MIVYQNIQIVDEVCMTTLEEIMHPHHFTSLLSEPRLGVDIGRVIICGDGPDTSFIGGSAADALRAPAVDGAFEALARLTVQFAGRVWLVSKCGPAVEARTRAWLDHHRFFELTGIAPGNLRFCRARPDKAPICKKLGIGFFVDDRWDVLFAMGGVVPHRFLFGAGTPPSPDVVAVPGWPAAEEAILGALGSVNPE